ncbi:MAG: hypothetical protein QOH30_2497, partial [Baekduia sp.]|nr:hypothetical protein [Baekduia sp.]
MTPRFEVQSFEQVPAGPGTVLLRIAGRWVGPAREQLPRPLLLLDDGRRTHRLSALPGPDDVAPQSGPEGLPWRAAFSAPADVVASTRLAFALEAGRGVIVDLPRPTGRGGGPRARPEPVVAPPADDAGRVRPFRRRAGAREEPPAAPPRPSAAGETARAADVAALRARIAEERIARENAERHAAEATSIARQAAAEAARAADVAARAEAARAGAVDALTDERMRASERAAAEDERSREHLERATRAADQARRAVDVAQEARRALEEREGEIAAAQERAERASRAARAAEARLAAVEQAREVAETRASE